MIEWSLFPRLKKWGVLWYLCLFIHPLSICQSVRLSFHPSVRLSICFHEIFRCIVLHYNDFWNLVSGFIWVSYTVWFVFRFITQQIHVYRSLTSKFKFFVIFFLETTGYHQWAVSRSFTCLLWSKTKILEVSSSSKTINGARIVSILILCNHC